MSALADFACALAIALIGLAAATALTVGIAGMIWGA